MKSTLKRVLRVTISLILVTVWMVTIFSMSGQSSEQSDETSGNLIRTVLSVIVKDYDNLSKKEQDDIVKQYQHFTRKAAHFTEYFILGVLIYNVFFSLSFKGWRWYLISAVIGAVYSVTDELHQLLVSGRACQVKDMLLDTSGVILGIAVFAAVIALIDRIRQKKSEADPQ